jgi:hypothetical protein
VIMKMILRSLLLGVNTGGANGQTLVADILEAEESGDSVRMVV